MGKRYALLIANFEYDNIKNLVAPKYDAMKLEEILKNKELGNFECFSLINKNSNEVQDFIEEFYDNKKQDDVLLLYYSGHGVRDKKRNLHLTCKSTSEGNIVKKAIKMRDINELIDSCQAKSHIIILDCCYSGAAYIGSKDTKRKYENIDIEELDRFIGGEGRVILTSSSKSEKSYENENISYYTEAIIKGIETSEADIDNDGKITVDELHKYVCKELKKLNPKQKPRIKSDQHDSIVISKAKKKEKETNSSKSTEKEKITILFLPSSPSDKSRNRFEKEYREIGENISKSDNRERLNLVSKWAVRKKDLIQAVNECNPNIIHISGSNEDEDITFEDNNGKYTKVSKPAMKRFVALSKELEMVVFNKSNSNDYAVEAVEFVEYAIGMDGVIEDDNAINFAFRLYSSIGFDRSYEESFNQAVAEVGLYNDLESNVPKINKKGIEDKLKKYKEKITKEFKILGLLGHKERFNIEGIYIPLTMHFDKNTFVRCDSESKCKLTERNFTAEKLLEQDEKTAIVLGKPGMGKTTMLRYLARIESKKSNGLIPLFIKLSDFSKKNIKLEEYIINSIKEFEDDREWIINEILKKNALVLLDGMDEVGEDNYNNVASEIRGFVNKYTNTRAIITSREARFKANLFPYCVYEIDKLPYKEIIKYINNWFTDVLMENKEYELENLKKCINNNKRIYTLSENPFLLSIICAIYEQDKSLPNRRIDLYRRCTEMLLTLYDIYNSEKKNIYTSSFKEEVLENISKNFFENGMDEFPRRSLLKQVLDVLKDFDMYGEEEKILNEICENSGILQKSNSNYLFVHRTFYEYYVACKYINDDDLRDKILNNIDNPNWEEVIRLYAGQIETIRDGTDFIKKVWEKDKAFAIRCYIDMNNVDSELIKELLKTAKVGERIELVKGLPDKIKSPEKIVETIKGLMYKNDGSKNETNGEVLYWIFDILKNNKKVKNLDEAKSIVENFDREAEKNYVNYMKEYMLDIPKGDFIMGDNSGYDSEKPEHRVVLDEFKMSKFIVTNELYEKFDPEHYEKRDKYSNKDNQPVLYVNWYDAYMFCRWCNCDLPTEAQWEHACRAGTKTKFNVGNNLNKNDANYGSNIGKTTLVGNYKENQFGLYDMHGNTFEWCQDWYDREFYKKYKNEKIVKNPINSKGGSNRVIRGGSWIDSAVNCRSAYRSSGWVGPGNRDSFVSFRPVSRKFIGRQSNNLSE